MATIHHLAAHQLATHATPTADHAENAALAANQRSAQSATIILFTGVRYERWPELAASAPHADLEAALSVPVDDTGAPRSKGPAIGANNSQSKG